MATMSQVVAPRMAFLGNDSKPASGYRLFTYAAGTTTKVTTYTSVGGTTPNTNPIVLDARGECDVWALPGLRLRLELYPPGTDDPPAQSLAVWTGSSGAQPDGILGIPDPQVSEWVPYLFNTGDVCFVASTKTLYIRGNVTGIFAAKRRVRVTTQVGDYYATITTSSATTGNSPASQVGDFNQSIVNITNGLTSLVLDFDVTPGVPANLIISISYGLLSTVNTSVPLVPVGYSFQSSQADQAKDFFPGSDLEKDIVTPGGRRIASAFTQGTGAKNEEVWSRYINLGAGNFFPVNGATATTMQLVFPKRSRFFAIDLVIGLLYAGTEIEVNLRGVATALANESVLYSCRIFGGTNTLDVRMAVIGTAGINGENLAGKMAFTFTLPAGGWLNGATLNVDDYEQVADFGATYYNPRTDGPIDVSFGVMPANNAGWSAPLAQDVFTQSALDVRYAPKNTYPVLDTTSPGTLINDIAVQQTAYDSVNKLYNIPKPNYVIVGRLVTFQFYTASVIEGNLPSVPYNVLSIKIPGVTSDLLVLGGGSYDTNLYSVIPGLIQKSNLASRGDIKVVGPYTTSIANLFLTVWFLN